MTDKKTADELLFEEEEKEKIVFRSMVLKDALLDDIIQKDKV
jgi:hypothetical protein